MFTGNRCICWILHGFALADFTCHYGSHYWAYYPGDLSLGQIIGIDLKVRHLQISCMKPVLVTRKAPAMAAGWHTVLKQVQIPMNSPKGWVEIGWNMPGYQKGVLYVLQNHFELWKESMSFSCGGLLVGRKEVTSSKIVYGTGSTLTPPHDHGMLSPYYFCDIWGWT